MATIGRRRGAPHQADRGQGEDGDEDTWIIVCEHFHGAVGPIPTERLAADLAALASEIGACAYRPVPLALARGRTPDRGDERRPALTDQPIDEEARCRV